VNIAQQWFFNRTVVPPAQPEVQVVKKKNGRK
jgi:hypothetical protein